MQNKDIAYVTLGIQKLVKKIDTEIYIAGLNI